MTGWAVWLAQAVAQGVRRRVAQPAHAALALEQVLALDPRRRLCLIRCGERRLLLLTGGAQDVSLGWLPDVPGP